MLVITLSFILLTNPETWDDPWHLLLSCLKYQIYHQILLILHLKYLLPLHLRHHLVEATIIYGLNKSSSLPTSFSTSRCHLDLQLGRLFVAKEWVFKYKLHLVTALLKTVFWFPITLGISNGILLLPPRPRMILTLSALLSSSQAVGLHPPHKATFARWPSCLYWKYSQRRTFAYIFSSSFKLFHCTLHQSFSPFGS